MKNKLVILIMSCWLPLLMQGQIQDYRYQRELQNVSENWHEFAIPNPMFGKVQPDLSDLRVYGIKDDGDTIEAPYMLNVYKAKAQYEDRRFRIYDQYWRRGSYYIIFRVLDEGPVNEIRLNVKNKNFDWKIDLEGSTDNVSWASVIDDYRVVNVSSKEVNYNYTTIRFPIVRYRYLKVKIPEKALGTGAQAITFEKEIFRGNNQVFDEFTYSVSEDKNRKASVIEINLPQAVPVSHLTLPVEDKYDFYRNVSIEYTTSDEWESWNSLAGGVISSIEQPYFQFENTVVKKIRIKVKNFDNEPLKFGKPALGGDLHTMTVRFNDPAKYLLVYGKPGDRKPIYDIDRFVKNIPDDPGTLKLGPETVNLKPGEKIVKLTDPETGKETATIEEEKQEPLIQNKIWLWGVMGAVIVLLGFFTLRMMRES